MTRTTQVARTRQESERKPSALESIEWLLGFKYLYTELSQHFPPSPRGHKGGYPQLLLLALIAATSACESQTELLRSIRDERDWGRVRDRYERSLERYLPGTPSVAPSTSPSAKVLDDFLMSISRDKQRIDVLRQALQTISMQLAKNIGNLRQGDAPDHANPDPRNVIMGDGTHLRTQTDVRQAGGRNGRVLLGSNASSRPARISNLLTKNEEDKPVIGVNWVKIMTYTEAGAVVLDLDYAPGGEVTTALPMIESAITRANRGVHSVVYDRALTGKSMDPILREGVQVIGRPISRVKREQDEPVPGPEVEGKQAYFQFRGLSLDILSAEAAFPIYRANRREGRHGWVGLPLGTSVYPTMRNAMYEDASLDDQTLVLHFGRVYRVPTRRLGNHQAPDTRCQAHSFWIDDDALVACTRDASGHYTKIGVAQSRRSSTRRGHDRTATWITEWELDCPHGRHRFTTHSLPGRLSDVDEPESKAFDRLRPLSRAHELRWAAVEHRRSAVEAHNSRTKAIYRQGAKRARALRLSVESQYVQMLGTWLLDLSNVHRIWWHMSRR